MTPARKFWLKLAGLGLMAGALVYQLTKPMPTHAVRVDLPQGSVVVYQSRDAFVRLQMLGALYLVALACVIWLAWRVYSRRPK